MNLLTRYLLLTLALVAPLTVHAKSPAAATSPAAAATSMLRVTCEGADAGAEVSVNGKFKGECPIDMQVAPGMLTLRVERKDGLYDLIFEQEIRMGDGVVKKVEAVLSKHLNASKQKIEDQRSAVIRAESEANGPAMKHIPGKNYELGKYEVTQGEWHAVMGNNPSKFSNCGDICPVENVSWDDVHVFIQKLNAKTGKQYRLPTEEEWMYACYGGSKTSYCGGNESKIVGWFFVELGGATHPVGQKQGNGYGLYDMSGNVEEWVEDCTDSSCSYRVSLGSSWGSYARIGRSGQYYETYNRPISRSDFTGFRVARTLP